MYRSTFRRNVLLSGVLVSFPLLNVPLVYAQGPDAVMDRPSVSAFVPGEVIVKMKKGAAAALPGTNLQQLGLESTPRRTSGGELIYKFTPQAMQRMKALSEQERKDQTLGVVEKLKADPSVDYAQPNWILMPFADPQPNDPLYPKQWHYFNNGTGSGESPGGINLPKAWAQTKGSDVVVAVIDTGILPDHPDIAGSPNLIKGYDFMSTPFNANDGDGRDADPTDPGDAMKKGECLFGLYPDRDLPSSWHGTHVAGTIGVGKTDNGVGIAGINWKVKVQALRVLGKCGGTSEDINDAIRWAAGIHVDGVPENPTPAKVINMSLGGGQPCSDSPATQQAINDAVAKGVTVVVAAGNDGKDASGYEPAGCDNVITVAANDPQGKLAPYSNWGETVEILAPGGWTEQGCVKPEAGVLSMVKTASDRGNCGVPDTYAFYNGTSMASPHAAGVAALLLSMEPNLTPTQVSARIQQNAIPRDATHCSKPCGKGLLNANFWEGPPTPPPSDKLSVAMELDPPPPANTGKYPPNTSITLWATVKKGDAPQPNKTVQFSSDKPGVASVSPPSAVTDANGQAKATVQTKQQAGDATVSATTDGVTGTKPVRVPDLSWISVIVLAGLLVLLGLWRKPTGAA